MRPRNVFILVLVILFFAGVGYALVREVDRETERLAQSISGIVEADPALFAAGLADIVRTDRLVLLLLDPTTKRPMALRFISPFIPPQAVIIGQENARGEGLLRGEFLVVGITDKDGEIFRVTPGEVYGRIPTPVGLGAEGVTLLLNEPFRGSLFNEAPAVGGTPGAGGQAQAEIGAELSIQGVVRASPALAGRVAKTDRLILLLFDPAQGRPVATQIVPHALLPQAFKIGVAESMGGKPGKAYQLRILTDKDGNPFGSAEGEIVGRSKEPIPLGSKGVEFEMDQPYRR